MKKLVQNKTLTTVLLIAAIALLIVSGVQTSRAALTYVSDNYIAQVDTKKVGLVILENGKEPENGTLLKELNGGQMPLPGVRYSEELSVKNIGTIESFSRVILYKYWVNEDGTKNTELSPDLISLEIGEGWMLDEEATTKEMCMLYYPKLLQPGEVTPPFITGITLDNSLRLMVTTTFDGTYTTTTFNYNGVSFGIEVEGNSVQTHSSGPAILSAWSVKIDVDEDGDSFSYGDPITENYSWGGGDSPAPAPETVTISYTASAGGSVSNASETLDPDAGTAGGAG